MFIICQPKQKGKYFCVLEYFSIFFRLHFWNTIQSRHNVSKVLQLWLPKRFLQD